MSAAPFVAGPATRLPSRDDYLYPPLAPQRSGALAVDALHTLYWEQCGNAHGVPVVFLHGGPGGGSAPEHRRYYDPAFYRIVLYDQRGAGQSTPLGELSDNTTPHLIADLEQLRSHLGIERWLVFGGRGDRPSRSPTPKPIRSGCWALSCAGSSSRAPGRSAGS